MRPFGIRNVIKLSSAAAQHTAVFVVDTSSRGFDEGDRTTSLA